MGNRVHGNGYIVSRLLNVMLRVSALVWGVDSVVYQEEKGKHLWIKESTNSQGERVGKEVCCEYGKECKYHKQVRSVREKQQVDLN